MKSGSCALVDPDDKPFNPNPKTITSETALSLQDLRLLASLLLDVNSWFFAKKRCLPRETAIIHLTLDSGDAKLSIGMPCLGWVPRCYNKQIGAFFGLVAPQIRGLLKRAFPEIASHDSRSLWKAGAISKLKEQRALDNEQ